LYLLSFGSQLCIVLSSDVSALMYFVIFADVQNIEFENLFKEIQFSNQDEVIILRENFDRLFLVTCLELLTI
jgi:hypothetical protein